MERFLLSYWCFYHFGTSCWIVEQPDFWKAMMKAAKSKDYKRMPERRHFRGENAVKSIKYLESRGMQDLFKQLRLCESLKHVSEEVEANWVGFGPWITFKIADMLERVLGLNIEFDMARLEVYSSPQEGAAIACKEMGLKTEFQVESIYNRIRSLPVGKELAPPTYDRMLNIQEIETILCKFSGYRKGSYKIGEDIEGLRKSLMSRLKTRTAQQLLKEGKKSLWPRKN